MNARSTALLTERFEGIEATQYEKDLAVLQREEDRIVEQGGSPADLEFFGAMGRLIAARAK